MLVSPCPGKCLPHAAMPASCRPRMIGAAQPRDVVGLFGQRPIADDRVLRVRVDVQDRRVVERDADRLQLRRQARANRSASATSPLRPSVAIGGHSVNGAFRRATRPPS